MRGLFRGSSSTKRSLLARITVGLLAAGALVPVTAGASQAITGPVDAHSFAITGSVKLLAAATIPIGTQADVQTSNSSTPVTNGLPSLNVVGAASAGVITTSAA